MRWLAACSRRVHARRAESSNGAAADGKAETELLAMLGRALPEEANARLESAVPEVLGRRQAIAHALEAARAELVASPRAGAAHAPSIVQA